MRRLLSQLRLDAMSAWRGKCAHATLGMALLFGALLAFAAPESMSQGGGEVFLDATPDRAFQALAPERFVADADALAAAVEEGAVGVEVRGSVAEPGVTFHVQGHESDETRALMASAAKAGWVQQGVPAAESHTVRTLDPQGAPAALKTFLLPLLFGLDTSVLGFLFAGVMVLQEKMNGTIRFYRASPGSAGLYITSKVAVNTALALAGAAVMTAFVAPASLLDARLWALLLFTVAGLTLLGVGLSVFFRNLSGFFYPLAAVALLLSAPMVPYQLPSTALPLLEWVPTHAVMFGALELLHPSGRGTFGGAMAVAGAWFVATAAFAGAAVHFKLMREA